MTNFKNVYFTMSILDNLEKKSEFANSIHIERMYYQNLATYPLWNFDSSLDNFDLKFFKLIVEQLIPIKIIMNDERKSWTSIKPWGLHDATM